MKYVMIILCGLVLVGCNQTMSPPTIKSYNIQLPQTPKQRCINSIPEVPETAGLTNKQLIEYISRLIRANKICKSALEGVYAYIEELQARTE